MRLGVRTKALVPLMLLAALGVTTAASASATLDIVGGVLTYTAGSGTSNVLTISDSGGNYTFSDSGETITLGGGATGAGWTGSGTNTVTG